MELKDILRVLRKRKWLLILIPLVAVLTSGVMSYFILEPVYQASATLMVGKTYAGPNGPLLQYTDILTANQLVKTYSQIAKSRTVAEQVIAVQNLPISPQQFSKMVSVQPVQDTQLIQIKVESADPRLAAAMANAAAGVFMEKVVSVMKVDNVNIVDPAVEPPFPVKPNKKLNMVISVIIGIMAAVGLVFLFEYLDQTIKSSEDINRYLEIPVLGTIPRISG
ncbi:MAG: lipopolysaccharide biosynthesis protein [Peptococcaceae bacterium]|nr:MAG: lipopolysaccharide biosynthesis protein [Peptococcaceae bacterium]